MSIRRSAERRNRLESERMQRVGQLDALKIEKYLADNPDAEGLTVVVPNREAGALLKKHLSPRNQGRVKIEVGAREDATPDEGGQTKAIDSAWELAMTAPEESDVVWEKVIDSITDPAMQQRVRLLRQVRNTHRLIGEGVPEFSWMAILVSELGMKKLCHAHNAKESGVLHDDGVTRPLVQIDGWNYIVAPDRIAKFHEFHAKRKVQNG